MTEEMIEEEKKLSAEISELMGLLEKEDEELDFDFKECAGAGSLFVESLEEDKSSEEVEGEIEEEKKDFFDRKVDEKKEAKGLKVNEMIKKIKDRPKIKKGPDSVTWGKLRKNEVVLSSLNAKEKRAALRVGMGIQRRNQHIKAVKKVKQVLIDKKKRNVDRRAEMQEVVKQLRADQDVDLVFLVDCTESMQHVIDAVMTNVTNITDYFENVFARVNLRVGFLGYRDATDFAQFEMCPLTTPETAKIWMEEKNKKAAEEKNCEGLAKGGGSTPEDIHGALYHVIKFMNWEKPTKVLIHIADCPPHGREYHDEGSEFHDPFPDGMHKYKVDDDGELEDYHYHYTLHQIVRALNRKGIFYNFGQVPFIDGKIITNTMVEKFRGYYDNEEKKMEVFDFTSEYRKKITHSVMRAVEESLRQSLHTFLRSKLNRKDAIKFKVKKDKKDRKWTEVQDVKCCFVSNEEKLKCETIEHYVPEYDKCVRKMRIENFPFAKGGIRYAFRMEDMNEKKYYVGKRIMEKELPEAGEKYVKEIVTQIYAKRLAQEFNKDMEKLGLKGRVEFITPQVVKMKINEHDNLFLGIEPFIEGGEFEKYNGNFGYVMPSELGVHNVPQAFSHYSFQKSRYIMLVCDIQGVKIDNANDIYLLTDPAINSHYDLMNKQDFDPNFGKDGYNEFFLTHQCCDLCRKLKLIAPIKKKKKRDR